LYPYETLEVRGTSNYIDPGAFTESTLSSDNEVPYLVAHGVRLARVHYEVATKGEPRVGTAGLHVLFELGDHLGSTSVVLDKATSELVEASTYQGYGAKASDYRPDRWKGFRDDYGFTGKEEDAEFGVVYFGKRFYSPGLNRWITADPLAVHSPGKADLNLYAYVKGAILVVVDPLGLVGNGDEGAGNVPASAKPVPQEYTGVNSGQGGEEAIAQATALGPLSLAAWGTAAAGFGLSCDSPPCVGPLADPATVTFAAGIGARVTSFARGVTAGLTRAAAAPVPPSVPSLTVQIEQAATAADGIVEKLAGGTLATDGVLPTTEVNAELRSLGNPNAPSVAPGGEPVFPEGGPKALPAGPEPPLQLPAPQANTTFVDPKGNALRGPPGGQITGSPDGRFVPVRTPFA
jgi:RHS repeat-associated protein